MILNRCIICSKSFTRPHNPNRVFKYCSVSCMGKDSEKAKKHSERMKGRVPWNKGLLGLQDWHDISGLNKGEPWNKGKSNPLWSRENNPNWKGGVTPENEKVRKSTKYKEWRIEVLKRDWFRCINCGHRSNGKYKDVVVDHIKPFSIYKELRFDVDNGRTLCQKCDSLLGWNYQRERKENYATT